LPDEASLNGQLVRRNRKKGQTMKKNLLTALVVTGLALGLHLSALAADDVKTITGEGACAKCVLKQADACDLTVTSEESGKKVTYHLAKNDIAKEFGKKLCSEKTKIKVTGIVKTVDGQQELTATKIEEVKS
jgi:hypothetical protein